MANPTTRLPEPDPVDPSSIIGDAEDDHEAQGRLWLPVLFGILCAGALVAALFGLTLLAIWWRG